jgi:hypothetical protein
VVVAVVVVVVVVVVMVVRNGGGTGSIRGMQALLSGTHDELWHVLLEMNTARVLILAKGGL